MEVDDPIARQLGSVASIKARELYAIKAFQPAESAEPKVPIGCLHHGRGSIFRRAFLIFPGIDQPLVRAEL